MTHHYPNSHFSPRALARVLVALPSVALSLLALSSSPLAAQLWTKRVGAAELQRQADQMRVMTHNMQAIAQGEGTVLAAAADTPAKELAPKRPGVTRIGIVLPADAMDGNGDLNAGEPVRSAEVQLLSGPEIEAVALKAVLRPQALQEARQLDCDYVLFSSVSQVVAPATGRFAKLGGMRTLQLASTAAQFVPGIGTAAMLANMAVTTAATQAATQTLSTFNKSVKANSDLTLQYELTDIAGASVLSTAEKAHSKGDGDNILTPMLTAAATRVVAAIAQKH